MNGPLDEDVDVSVGMTEQKAWEVFYALTNIRDTNLLQADEVAAIEFINTAITQGLREHAEEVGFAKDALRKALHTVIAEGNHDA